MAFALSEQAYAGIGYIRATDDNNNSHVALVVAKTKVAPIKHLTIPCLELCQATILAKLMNHVAHIVAIPDENLFAQTDRNVIHIWLCSNPNRFKTFVGN